MLQPFKGEKPPPKSSTGKRHWAGIQKLRFPPHRHALPFVFPSPISSQLQAKYSLESANILNMCPKGKQWDAEKWLCHIWHISLAPISHMPTPVLAPLKSPSALPSGSGLPLHRSPSFSPAILAWLAPSSSHATAQPSSPHHPDPERFDTPAFKICGYWNQVLMHGGFNLKFTCLQVSTAP